MKYVTFSIFVLILILSFTIESVERIACLDFKPENISVEIISDILDILREELKKNYNVMSKIDMEKMLNESGYKKDCFSTECFIQAGNILNVDKIFTGNLSKVANIVVIEIRVVDIKYKKIALIKSKKCNNIQEVMEFAREFIEEYIITTDTLSTDIKSLTKETPKTLEEVKKYYKEESESSESNLNFGIGGLFGYNYLLKGYDKYSNDFMFGVEFKMRLLTANEIESLNYRLYFDYFPMAVPEGTYNLQEDIYNVNIGAIYGFLPNKRFNPFIGVGLGLYLDWIRFETPASGNISNTYTFFGFNLSGGLEIFVKKRISLIPEARFHFILEPGRPVFLARNLSLHSTLIYYFK